MHMSRDSKDAVAPSKGHETIPTSNDCELGAFCHETCSECGSENRERLFKFSAAE